MSSMSFQSSESNEGDLGSTLVIGGLTEEGVGAFNVVDNGRCGVGEDIAGGTGAAGVEEKGNMS